MLKKTVRVVASGGVQCKEVQEPLQNYVLGIS